MGIFVNNDTYDSLKAQIITEAYFGDSQLRDAQKYLSAFRQQLMETRSLSPKTNKNLQLFNREIEKVFGFYIFSMEILEDHYVNAFTMPVSCRIGYKKKRVIFDRKKGYRYAPDTMYCTSVFITRDFITSKVYTDREIMAVILHEIGHNFQSEAYDFGDNEPILNVIQANYAYAFYIKCMIDALLRTLSSMDPTVLVQTAANITSDLLFENMYVVRCRERILRNFRTSFPEVYQALEIYNTIVNKLWATAIDIVSSGSTLISLVVLMNPASILYNVAVQTLRYLNPTNFITNRIDYQNERFSDNFATMYGYGPETASVQQKLSKTSYGNTADRVLMNTPLLQDVYGLLMSPIAAVCYYFDEHPLGSLRIQDQADLLEEELQSKFNDPRMKAQIKKQLLEVNKIAAEYDDLELPDAKPRLYYLAAEKAILASNGGKDFGAYLNKGHDLHASVNSKFDK